MWVSCGVHFEGGGVLTWARRLVLSLPCRFGGWWSHAVVAREWLPKGVGPATTAVANLAASFWVPEMGAVDVGRRHGPDVGVADVGVSTWPP